MGVCLGGGGGALSASAARLGLATGAGGVGGGSVFDAVVVGLDLGAGRLAGSSGFTRERARCSREETSLTPLLEGSDDRLAIAVQTVQCLCADSPLHLAVRRVGASAQ